MPFEPRNVARVWPPKPGQLWSLWDMYPFSASVFVSAVGMLQELSLITKDLSTPERNGQVRGTAPDEDGSGLDERFSELAEVLVQLSARITGKVVRDMQIESQSGYFTYMNLERYVKEIHSTLKREMEGVTLYAIDPRYADLIASSDPPFGEAVYESFPDTASDVNEAAMCLGLLRGSAAVFHLMRALEGALVAAGAKLEATLINKNGEGLPWGVVLSNLKGKIDAMPEGEEKDEWCQAHALLHSVNRAWRTKTMHPKETYTAEEADEAYNATKAFMKHLATLVPPPEAEGEPEPSA
jgi:hypothetical protein